MNPVKWFLLNLLCVPYVYVYTKILRLRFCEPTTSTASNLYQYFDAH